MGSANISEQIQLVFVSRFFFSTACCISGDGLALEAALRFKRVCEETNQDKGQYIRWQAVLEKHGGDVQKSTDFVRRRRCEQKGTSTCRNSSEETFLWFEPQERTLKQTSLDP